MSRDFEELDYAETRLGELILRRRRILSLDDLEIYEVKLGDAFLMSSLFTTVEVALAELGLAAANEGPLDVVVGGLGLGYTAAAALANDAVRSLIVVEALAPVISWHERGLVPIGSKLTADSRCRFVHGDFFGKLSGTGTGFDPLDSGRRFDVVLLDIDHSPRHLLDASHSAFYETPGLERLASQLNPGGVFALWSDDPPDDRFLETLRQTFATAKSEVVRFPNPLLGTESASTVYVANKAAGE